MPTEQVYKAYSPLAPGPPPASLNPPTPVKDAIRAIPGVVSQVLGPKPASPGYDPLLASGGDSSGMYATPQYAPPSMWAQWGLPEWTPWALGAAVVVGIAMTRKKGRR